VSAGGGHATLLRADDAVRSRVPVFQPQPAPLAALTKRVKQAFDPKGALNPGRMIVGV
jgi:glycolate oxidase FAD binding subunit